MSNESEGNAEAGLSQKTTILRVCNLPYFSQHVGCYSCLFKEVDGDLASDDAETLLVGLREEGAKVLLLLCREI